MAHNKIFLVATETSGDFLGARMVRELLKLCPGTEIVGVGGDQLKAEGMKQIYHVRDFNVMGFLEVVLKLWDLKAKFNHLVRCVKKENPTAIILIDSPDFNMRFAKAVGSTGIPVIYYVSPQIWAWREGRAKTIANIVDHLILLFGFEKKYYENLDIETTVAGHPLVDEIAAVQEKRCFFDEQNIPQDKPVVAIAPGSRHSEVARLLPVMKSVIRRRQDRYTFVLPLAPALNEVEVLSQLGDVPVHIVPNKMREVMAHADAAIVASGTATLETGLLQTPMVVGYKMNPLSYYLAKTLVKMPCIALVNIVLGKKVVPELIQKDFHPDKILPQVDSMIEDSDRRQKMIDEFSRLPEMLGGGGSDIKAAEVVRKYLKL